MKGDGTDLCCIVNPIRKCIYCGIGHCNDHWWVCCRTSQGLNILPGHGSNCIKCGKATPYKAISSGLTYSVVHSLVCQLR